MRNGMRKLVTAAALVLVLTGNARATPSTQVWIPSTDIQPYMTLHLNFDNYIRTAKSGGVITNTTVIGPTVGVLPFEKIQAEVGFDYMDAGTGSGTDRSPLYGHGKVGTPEDSLFKYSPAIAIGIYNMGTKTSGSNMTKQNIAYGLVARTLPVLGRISVGGFHGSASVLTDENGRSANDGLLLSWDRTMTEISEKLWLAVDYQSSKSAVGALNFGIAWAFAKNVTVIFGYDIYNNAKTGGEDTVTTQVDINFP